MAEEEKEEIPEKYKNKGWKDLETLAGEVSSMTDHEARVDHTRHMIRAYDKSHVLHEERRAPILMLMAGGDKTEEMQNIYKGLDEAHKNKKGDLEYKVVVDWLKKFADAIMPVMGLGAEGETQGNYNNLKMYLMEFDKLNDRDPRTTLSKVRALIEKGHGFEASAEIIEAIKIVKENNQFSNFMDMLLPPGDTEHKLAAAKKIAEDVNDHLKKGKDEYRVDPAFLGENIVRVYQLYATGDFKKIVDYDKSRRKQR